LGVGQDAIRESKAFEQIIKHQLERLSSAQELNKTFEGH